MGLLSKALLCAEDIMYLTVILADANTAVATKRCSVYLIGFRQEIVIKESRFTRESIPLSCSLKLLSFIIISCQNPAKAADRL